MVAILSRVFIKKNTVKIALPVKTPSQDVGEEGRPVWLREGLVWGCRN